MHWTTLRQFEKSVVLCGQKNNLLVQMYIQSLMSFISNECFGPRTSTMTSKISTVQIKKKRKEKKKSSLKAVMTEVLRNIGNTCLSKELFLQVCLAKDMGWSSELPASYKRCTLYQIFKSTLKISDIFISNLMFTFIFCIFLMMERTDQKGNEPQS